MASGMTLTRKMDSVPTQPAGARMTLTKNMDPGSMPGMTKRING